MWRRALPQPDSTPGTLPSAPATGSAPAPLAPLAPAATLTIGLAGEPANWNPLAAPARPDPALALVVEAVLPSAFVAGPAATPTRNTALLLSATETPVSPETVVYRIDPRAVWSDGVPITAADFVATWEAQSGQPRYRDVGGRAYTPAATDGYRQISSVSAAPADPDQVTVRFASPYSDWESLFAPLLPAHVVHAVGFDHGFTDPVTSLVSGGPFLVQSYAPGDDVVLVRNPRWWGPAAGLATLDVAFVSSASVAAEGLEQGQLDAAVSAFTPALVTALRATPRLTVSVAGAGAFDDLVLGERGGPLAVRAVRMAVMLAVDRQAVARSAEAGGDTAAAPLANRTYWPGVPGSPDKASVLGPAGTGPARARAVQLLEAAGGVTHGSTLMFDGTPVHLTLAVETSSPLAAEEVSAVVAGCRALGIAVTIIPRPAATTHPFVPPDGMALVSTARIVSPAAAAETYATGGGANLSGYSSPVMDGLLLRLANAPTGPERNELVDQVDAQAWNDAVDLPLLAVPEVLAYQSRYANLTAAPSPSGLGDDLARWGIPQAS